MDLKIIESLLFNMCLINGGILLFSTIIFVCLTDLLYDLQARFFNISQEKFNATVCFLLGGYKIMFLIFNLAPYIAIRLL